MRIALNHTRYSRAGGVERFLSHLADFLVERGHEVHFFGLERGSEANPEVVFHRVPRVRGSRALRVLSFAHFSARLLRKERFDIIQGCGKTYYQHIYRDGSGSRAAYEKMKGMSVFSRWSPGRRAQLWVDRRKYREGAYEAIIAISELVKGQIVRDYGVPTQSVRVIHNGADVHRFSPIVRSRHRAAVREQLGLSADSLVVLLVASDLERKGAPTLIRALAGVPDLTLVVVGDDGSLGRFQKLAADSEVAKRVRFVGKRSDVERMHGAADVFALLSRFDAIANAALEALASGLPVVVSAKDGIAELVRDGDQGFVIEDPDDSNAVAKVLETLRDRALRERMGASARRLAETVSLEQQLERYLEVFLEVVAERQQRGKARRNSMRT